MEKIPFSVYDFFGYLSAGAVLLSSFAFATDGFDALENELSGTQLLIFIVASYVVGHVVASVSSALLERRLTYGLLGRPTENLFGSAQVTGWRRAFAAYCIPLPAATQARVLAKARDSAGLTDADEALRLHCFGVASKAEHVRGSMSIFLNLYGFARNVSMAALLAALVLVISALDNDDVAATELLAGALFALIVGVVLYFRYLKFYRLHAHELYVHYAEAD